MDRCFLLRFIPFFVLVLGVFCHARESVLPIRIPSSYAIFGGNVELLDDVYSADAELAGEYAPCNCFSVYADFAYRFVSYEFDTMLHDQRHEALNLDVNGFNESYLGMKMMPNSFLGVDINWRLPPGEGSQVNRFHRLGVSPFVVYPFSKGMNLGASMEYFTFLDKRNFQPGDELGVKASISWKLAWDYDDPSGWLVDYVFLYRWRIQESENMNMDKPYRKMDDLYRGFRLRLDAGRYWAVAKNSLGVAMFYEMNRGDLFGFETGHTIGFYTKFMFR